MNPPSPRHLPDGRISIGLRPLSEAEQVDLKARYAKRARSRTRWIAAWLLLALLVYSKIHVTSEADRHSSFYILLWVTLIGMGLFTTFLLIWVVFNRLFRMDVVRLSANATEVERFRDPLDATGEKTTEIILKTSEVFSRDGKREMKAQQLQVLQRGVAPPFVAILGSTRSLSPDEIREIEAIVKRGHRKATRGAYCLFGSIVLLFGVLFALPTTLQLSGWIGLGACVLSACLATGVIVEAYSTYLFHLDAQRGQVYDMGRQERLFHSRFAWTVNGEPDSWRSQRLSPS